MAIQKKLDNKAYIANSNINFKAWYNKQINRQLRWYAYTVEDDKEIDRYIGEYNQLLKETRDHMTPYRHFILNDENVYIIIGYLKGAMWMPCSLEIKWNFEAGSEKITYGTQPSYDLRFSYAGTENNYASYKDPKQYISKILDMDIPMLMHCSAMKGKKIRLEELEHVFAIGHRLWGADYAHDQHKFKGSKAEKDLNHDYFWRFRSDLQITFEKILRGERDDLDMIDMSSSNRPFITRLKEFK